MIRHVTKALLLRIVGVLCISAEPDAYTDPCALDEIFFDNVCRPFTNTECMSRYGNVSSFDPAHGRCVWRLPDGAKLSSLKNLTGTDHCVLPRRLLAMLIAANPSGGIAFIPAELNGTVTEQLLCGRVDLRPWSSAALPISAQAAVATAFTTTTTTRTTQSAPWWAVFLLVLLSLAVPALLAVVVWLGRKIWRVRQERHMSLPPQESAPDAEQSPPCHTVLVLPCEKVGKGGESPETGERMRRIERLSESVINRIAAGEVVQRPSAALKEILENALDAGSTSIQVIVRDGGMELLQVTDDGHGIHRDDLPLLCERYATSKLRSFEDLSSISSFGFRGEALSSISYVARVTVTTMRRAENAALAWRCQFMDGAMQNEPQPCAGNPGTTIRVERMFYNSAVRRRALSRTSEEYSRIVTVVARYALAFPHVSFTCRRDEPNGSSAKGELFFPKDSTTLANIGIFHGNSTASHLHALHCVGVGPCGSAAAVLSAPADAEGCFRISGFTSGATLVNRRAQLCLFANNRLVESSVIRRALDTVYSNVLTGGQRPFTVLFITVPPGRIDVNIHPTKHEVALLDEETIVAQLSEAVRGVLAESAARRQLDSRHLLAKAAGIADRSMANAIGIGAGRAVVAPCTMVRVEPQRGALDAFVKPSATAKTSLVKSEPEPYTPSMTKISQPIPTLPTTPKPTPLTLTQSTCTLTPPVSQVWTQEKGERVFASRNESDAVDEVTSARVQMDSLSHAPAPSHVVRTEITPPFSIPASFLLLDQATAEDEDEDIMADFKRHRREVQASACDTMSPEPIHADANSCNKVNEENETNEANDTNSAMVVVGQEDVLLTSIATIVAQLRAANTATATALFDTLAYVGTLSPQHFLAQSGTTLYAVDTLRLVRAAVYQRVFFRWAYASLPAPPQLVLQEPMRIADLLRFAMQHDGATLRSHTDREKVAKRQNKKQKEEIEEEEEEERTEEDATRVVSRLERRLHHWRCMLQEYFAIDISADGYLLALPFGLNTSWPPVPRVVPLFVWRLAADVPYGEDEIACFTAIAQHIAETLYGMRLHDAWMRPRSEDIDNNNNYNNGDDRKEEAHNEETVEHRKRDGEGQTQQTGQTSSSSLGDAIRFGLVPCVTSAKFFAPPADTLVDGTLQAIVSVEELYKVFERC